jgi:hypothetical protein
MRLQPGSMPSFVDSVIRSRNRAIVRRTFAACRLASDELGRFKTCSAAVTCGDPVVVARIATRHFAKCLTASLSRSRQRAPRPPGQLRTKW